MIDPAIPPAPTRSGPGDWIPPLVVVVGPTATGKSALAEAVSSLRAVELVSADAFQLYRGLDIGTAKPTAAARARYRYHCLDLLRPDERCTAGQYARIAHEAIAAIRKRGRIPVLVGGSGFYVDAVVHGLSPLPESDPAWRSALTQLGDRRGSDFLFAMLARLDPARAGAIAPADSQRLLRALEVVLRTGRPVAQAGSLQPDAVPAFSGRVLWFGIEPDRAAHRHRIARRVETMIAAGWLEEVGQLLASGYDAGSHGMQAIGYRELADVWRGERELRDAVDHIVLATRRYAKRQMTWFRRHRQIEWLRPIRPREAPDSAALEPWVRRLVQRIDEP